MTTYRTLAVLALLHFGLVNADAQETNSMVVFESDRDGNSEIYVMWADGSAQKRLTDNPAGDHHPSWSPDGSRIAFESDRDGNSEIYVMNADGSSQRRLTDNSYDDNFPSWSPDSSQIAFSTDRDGKVEVYVMNSDGSDQSRLTNSTVNAKLRLGFMTGLESSSKQI